MTPLHGNGMAMAYTRPLHNVMTSSPKIRRAYAACADEAESRASTRWQ